MPQGSKTGRVLGVDYGEARIGIAVSDELQVLARAVTTLEVQRGQDPVRAVSRAARRLQARTVVIGYPRNMDGSEGDATARVQDFASRLEKQLALPVRLVDERLSTLEAERFRQESSSGRRAGRGAHRRQDPGSDAYAAAVILQRYLDGERPAMLEPAGAADEGSPRG